MSPKKIVGRAVLVLWGLVFIGAQIYWHGFWGGILSVLGLVVLTAVTVKAIEWAVDG